jgi:ABC transporter related
MIAENISFAYKKEHLILNDISLEVNSGEIVCVLGPNGTGKTTMLRCLLGFNKPSKGKITIDGKQMHELGVKNRAKCLAYVPQYSSLSFPYTVKEVVLMGRTAYLSYGMPFSKVDYDFAIKTIDRLGISHISDSLYNELSGGQKQMVLLARALTQDAKILIMDEPTANLDYSNQVKMLETIKQLVNEGYGILMTSHFPNHAFLTESRVILMKGGKKLYDGNPDEIITTESLTNLYQTSVEVSEINIKAYEKSIKVCVPILK